MAMLATARLFYLTTIKLCKYENLNRSYVDFDCVGHYHGDNGRGRNGYDSLPVFRQIVGNIVSSACVRCRYEHRCRGSEKRRQAGGLIIDITMRFGVRSAHRPPAACLDLQMYGAAFDGVSM